MKNFLLSISCLVTCLIYSQKTITPINRVEGQHEGYLQHLPANFKLDSGKKLPMIIVFHGNGEFGNGTDKDTKDANGNTIGGLNKLYNTGLPKIIRDENWAYKDQFIVLMYQDYATKKGCATGYDVRRFVDYAREKYKNSADLSRVYLTGYSCGGNAINQYLALDQNKGNVAAAVPISANGLTLSNTLGCNVTIPMWALHGALDTDVSPVVSDRSAYSKYAACSNLNGKTKYSELNGIGHGGWDEIYRVGNITTIKNSATKTEYIDIFKWMLTFSTNPPAICVAPTLTISNITSATAKITWLTTEAKNYTLYITPNGGAKYTQQLNFTGNSYDLSGLTPNKTYLVELSSNCENESVSSTKTFSTLSEPNNCTAPIGTATNIKTTEATISWQSTGAKNYSIYITPSGGAKYEQAVNFAFTSYNLSQLAPNKSYTIELISNCEGTVASSQFTFTTKVDPDLGINSNNEVNSDENSQFKAYPNPFTSEVNLSFSLDNEEKVSISVYNVNGSLVKNILSNGILSSGKHIINWNVNQNNGSNVSAGIYFCKIVRDNKTETIKLIVTK